LSQAILNERLRVEAEVSSTKTTIHTGSRDAKTCVSYAIADPVLRVHFEHLLKQVEEKDARIVLLQEELRGVQFNPNASAGRKLIARCRTLQRENEELGAQLSEGRYREMEKKIAMQASLIAELQRTRTESLDLVLELNALTQPLKKAAKPT
jgi:hypothetical protein